ncbi:cob(I)yrinic acid a,c-diamide adenosyltransferase [Anoxynatronum buryatiense]|uniref:Cob(I)alamin adenosyltransferase n=1 Tax=Anoxynatronum buryatiense TaxID=489973 RepID=A0AA45WYN0_9CLOT|nr:cob(I)yrinic acid a,c-diamide adenosyltransferase [Anoxynatronum buryatiense]SMP69520.1 cob(I)alamin adenosyltransferase [Anoxynatronum buryatiense]
MSTNEREPVKDQGYIQVYTGNGKGKTTAALGLALRAICAGKKVFMGQFIKGMVYSELNAVQWLPGLVIEQFGRDCFIRNNPTEEDTRIALQGLERAREILKAGEYDVVILDEINVALYYQLFTQEAVLALMAEKPAHVELVLTGRYAPETIMNAADLVTEMKEVKHYYTKGVNARKGIEN